MNLRLEAILKKEKSLYKDITDELKGKKFAKLNSGLEKTIAMLLERKQLIEQLNKEALEDAEREALYKSIEDNNKYFAEEVDREDINNQFMQADDSLVRASLDFSFCFCNNPNKWFAKKNGEQRNIPLLPGRIRQQADKSFKV